MAPTTLPYTLKTSLQALHIRITIRDTGEVIVTKPRLVPEFMVRKFVQQKEAWIQKTLAKIEKLRPKKSRIPRLWYKGVRYQWKFTTGKWNLVWGKKYCTVSAYSEIAAKRNITIFLQKEARKTITTSVKHRSKQMGIAYQKIQFKDQRTRWGSCSSTGNLNFNIRLIMAPPACLDYVVIHELAHRKQMNHSVAFWKWVEEFDPLYRENRRWLQRHGRKLEWI